MPKRHPHSLRLRSGRKAGLVPALVFAIAAAGSFATAPALGQTSASAADSEQVRATLLNLLRALVDQGVLSAAKAQEMLRSAGIDPAVLAAPQVTPAASPQNPPPPKEVVRVPYVPQSVRDEIRDQVKQEVVAQARAERWGDPGTLPSWLSTISLYGDLKVRFQSDRYASSNDSVPEQVNYAFGLPQGTIVDSTQNRDRMRVRARLGFDAKVSEDVVAGARIVTTAASEDPYNPTSEYFDAGQSNQRYGAAIDLAFIRWNALRSLSFSVGRLANPYYGTDLVWAADTSFDSAVVRWHPQLTNKVSAFATLGAQWLLSSSSAPGVQARDVWLYALQVGADGARVGRSDFTIAGALYDFRNIQGQLNPALPAANTLYSNSAVPYRKPGNTMFDINFLTNPGTPLMALASKFRLVDVATHYEWRVLDPMAVGATAEFVRNIGFDASEINSRIGAAAQALPTDITGATSLHRRRVNGYLVQLQVGVSSIDKPGDWIAFTGYRRLERDSVVAELTSADYRLGGTDQTAQFFGFEYGLARNTSLRVRYIAAKSLDLAPQYNIDTWLADIQAKF